ncbi:MAG TPA: response regulator [Terriglobia bacterium]|nr:response regulator [Terriglobia bacterium]
MPRKILVIDDEDSIREVTQVTLEMLSEWKVQTARSGREGIRLAAADPPDAILLDVMMPDMDGPATLQELASSALTRDIPVLFLTAKVQATDIRRFLGLGVKGVIAKPFDPLDLARQVAEALGWEPEQREIAERRPM